MSENLQGADAAVKNYLYGSKIIIQTDAPTAQIPPSFDPTMWGALFLVWVLLYLPRLIKALIKGADKYEPNIFDGWWIVGIGFLFWGYNEQMAIGDAVGLIFMISLVFWPLWLSKHKFLNKIESISRQSRIWISVVTVWILLVFSWVFGEDLWDAFANEEMTSFLLILLFPPIIIAFLWKLYRWINTEPKT